MAAVGQVAAELLMKRPVRFSKRLAEISEPEAAARCAVADFGQGERGPSAYFGVTDRDTAMLRTTVSPNIVYMAIAST